MTNVIISGCPADDELRRVHAVIASAQLVHGRADLEAVLGRLLYAPVPWIGRTLDFVGPSSAAHALLELGDWVLDAANPTVMAFFRELHDQEVLPRLSITKVRVLGSATAITASGRATITALADVLGVEVAGTTGMIGASHFGPDGFLHASEASLISSRELRAGPIAHAPLMSGRPVGRRLDIDGLRREPSDAIGRGSWPRFSLSVAAAREILALVERDGGQALPGMLASPRCELMLPIADAGAGATCRLQVLARDQLVRVFPTELEAGVLYPVTDSAALGKLLDRLPIR